MDQTGFSRRILLQRAAGLGALAIAPAILAACGSDSANAPSASADSDRPKGWPDEFESNEVVFATFGGLTYEVIRRISLDPFTEISGVKVIETPWDYGKFVAMVDSKNPEWDMIDFDGFSTVGLLQSGVKLSKLEPWVRRSDLVDAKYRDYASGCYSYSTALGWSTKLESEPSSWQDFFDTEKFPGKRAFPKSVYAGTAEIALMADGVSKSKMYPLDFDRAFRKLSSIKDHLLFYDSLAQGQQFMTQGSAVMLVAPNSRCEQLKQQASDFDYTLNDAVLYPWGAFPMPEHLRNRDATNALIDWMAAPTRQAAVARDLALGPTVSEAFDLLNEEELARTPNSPENRKRALVVNTEIAAKQDGEYATRYSDWVAS